MPRSLRRQVAAERYYPRAEFLRFTSPVRTPYPENDRVNARWFPAPPGKTAGKPKQAIIVMPHWNADAFSHNALCSVFNRFGVSALRLSKPYHDIRRPAELARADYAVSANVGRTIASCRQAVVDIRCCIDWLEQQGYAGQFGISGNQPSGSCLCCLSRQPLRSTAAYASPRSIMPPCRSVMWFGRDRARGTFVPPSNP